MRPHWGRRALISLLTLRWEQNTETQEPVETRQRPDGCGLKPRNPGAPTPGWERQEGPSPTDLRGVGAWPQQLGLRLWPPELGENTFLLF